MARSSWKGYLKLSLVSCAVALYNASSASERVSFNNLNRKTGNRLKQNLVDSVTGEPVDTAERVKGYQVAKGQYVMVEDSEIEALKIESTRTIEIETFVPQAEIDQIYVDSPYYLAPDDKVAEEAFAVIREAMTKKKMVVIDRMSGHFEPETFTDRYEEAVVAMLRAKQQGQTFTMAEPAAPANVVNIMDALKKSLEAAGGEGAVRRPRAPSKTAEAPAAKAAARKPVAKKPAARKAARG